MAQKAEMNLINPSTGLYEPYHLQTEPNMILGWARKKSTAYAVGDVVRLSALDVNKKLVCVKAGTSAAGNLTVSSTAEGALITDGTCVWQVDSFADGNYDAAHQNGIYRGADITAYWQSGHMSTNIRAGKFVGMHIGDYIVKTVNLPAITYTNKSGTQVTQAAQTFTNVKWLLGAFNPYLASGDTYTTSHHVAILPSTLLQTSVAMNPTDDTTGGYLGSDMWNIHMPNWSEALKNAFGESHILKYRDYLGNSVNTTKLSDGLYPGTTETATWVDVCANIPSEQIVYGSTVLGNVNDIGACVFQFPIFAYDCSKIYGCGFWTWTRSVSGNTAFAVAGGRSTRLGASTKGNIIVFALLY